MPNITQIIDEVETLSMQDYGPWRDAATMYRSPDGILLCVECGYDNESEGQRWYKLSDKPALPLSDLIGKEAGGLFEEGLWADTTSDQSDLLSGALGVQVHEVVLVTDGNKNVWVPASD